MSTFTNLITGALQTAASLYNPGGTNYQTYPSEGKAVGSVVSLGDGHDQFFFYETEVPEDLPLGGSQVSNRHFIPGKGSAFDTYGALPDSIEFSGDLYSLNARTLYGNEPAQLAIERMQILYRLWINETPVHFKFHKFDWKVVVTYFKPVVHHSNHVSYTIRLGVISDPIKDASFLVQRGAGLVVKPSVNLIMAYTNYVSNISAFLTQLQATSEVVAGDIVALGKNPGAVLYSGVALVPGASQTLTLLNQMTSFMSNWSSYSTIIHPQTLMDMENAKPYETLDANAVQNLLAPQVFTARTMLSSIVDYLLNYHALVAPQDPATQIVTATNGYQALANLGIMHKSLLEMVTPELSPSITVENPDLYQLALRYYGDTGYWQTIADANNLNNPRPSGLYTLKIPVSQNTSATSTSAVQPVGNS